jgi:hypothetical protein
MQLPRAARFFHHTVHRACDSRKTKAQAAQIATRIVNRMAAFFNRAKQFGHRAVKTFAKPFAFERRPRVAIGGIKRNGMLRQARPRAESPSSSIWISANGWLT